MLVSVAPSVPVRCTDLRQDIETKPGFATFTTSQPLLSGCHTQA